MTRLKCKKTLYLSLKTIELQVKTPIHTTYLLLHYLRLPMDTHNHSSFFWSLFPDFLQYRVDRSKHWLALVSHKFVSPLKDFVSYKIPLVNLLNLKYVCCLTTKKKSDGKVLKTLKS